MVELVAASVGLAHKQVPDTLVWRKIIFGCRMIIYWYLLSTLIQGSQLLQSSFNYYYYYYNTGSLSCTNGFISLSSLSEQAKNSTVESVHFFASEIILIPDMKFTCNDSLIGVYITGRIKGCCQRYPELLIWRISSNKGNDLYSLVSRHEIKPRNGRYYYKFAEPVSFLADDIIGIHQPSSDDCFQLAYDSSLPNAPLAYKLNTSLTDKFPDCFDINNSKNISRHTLLLKPKCSKCQFINIIIF